MTTPPNTPTLHLLVSAGPTYEPIDEVRFIGNRSSGRVGVAIADEAARRGWSVTLLLGPGAKEPHHSAVNLVRFRTTAELEAALKHHAPRCDVLVMAAAVADYRPISGQSPGQNASGKISRGAGELVLRLESTPDLIAAEAARKRDDQLFVAFALEPRDRMLEAARAKRRRKRVDAIVANPLETMDADTIEATLISADTPDDPTPGPIAKADFAPWLLERLETLAARRQDPACSR